LREAIGTALSPLQLQTLEPYIAAPRAQVDDAAWETAWQEGRRMSLEQTVEYALSDEEPLPAKMPVPEESLSGLTSREVEVATLVARGLTNRQIASELSISEHTVANHIAKILRRLELGSRSQLTAWVVERQTPP
jgi:DNA-binding NarL/FixJ family response regulator